MSQGNQHHHRNTHHHHQQYNTHQNDESNKSDRLLKDFITFQDQYLNGTISDRLERERGNLLKDENRFKKKLESVANFRKTEIIPIGKLQRAIDESDSESEPMSLISEDQEEESQEDQDQEDGVAGINHSDRMINPGIITDRQTHQIQSSSSWDNGIEFSPGGNQTVEMPQVDLDAELEDMDDDRDQSVQATLNDEEESSRDRSHVG